MATGKRMTWPGELDRHITIENPTYSISDDTNDKYPSSWNTYKSCFSRVYHKQSQEVFESGQMVAKDTHEFKVWYYDAEGVKTDMRINYDDGYYYIIGIKELGRKEAYLITAIKRDN